MLLPYEWQIGWRYTLVGRQDRFVSFVTLMSATGIALGVAALIVVLSVMGGFHQELRGRILSVASHLEALAPPPQVFTDWRAVADAYLRHPSVIAAAPLAQKQALLIRGAQTQGVAVRGILPAAEQTVSDLHESVTAGDLSALRPGAFAAFLGARLARRLQAKVGDELTIVIPQGSVTAAGFYPRMRRLQVAGIFASGLYQYDSDLLFMHIDDAVALYKLGGITSLRLKLRDVLDAPAVRAELQSVRPEVRLYDWTTSHGGLFRAVQLERRVMFIILTMIIAVAAFNIVSALVTMVRGKRGNIAILRAVGATRGGIARVFLCQGMLIGVAGTLLGILLGLPLAYTVGDIVSWLEEVSGRALFPGSVYHLEKLPSIVNLSDVAAVAAVSLLLSLVATVYPAWYASRLNPADSLRYE